MSFNEFVHAGVQYSPNSYPAGPVTLLDCSASHAGQNDDLLLMQASKLWDTQSGALEVPLEVTDVVVAGFVGVVVAVVAVPPAVEHCGEGHAPPLAVC